MLLVRRFLEAALAMLVIGILGIALAIAAAPATGHTLFAVRSASMAPAIHVGDLVVETRAESEDIRSGDVVTFETPNGATVTHRVVSLTPNDAGAMLTTRGDANPTADPVATPTAMIRGRVVAVLPMLGYVLAMLTTPSGVLALFSVGAMLLTAIWLLSEGEGAREDDELAELARTLGVPWPAPS